MNAPCNFVYIGPDKAGSTWLFKLLSSHPDVFITPAKDLYFFDRYYAKGMDWYAAQFADHSGQAVVGEISHDYLFSREAAGRIQQHLPSATLAVCLREPVDRTFSAYLHLLKTGHFRGTFEEALEQCPNIIDRSLYGKHVSAYLDYFDRDQIHIAVFDELQQAPQQFADDFFAALQVSQMTLPEFVLERSLPAGRSRSVWLTQSIRWVGNRVRDAGFPGIVGRVKTSSAVQRLLYQPYGGDEKPRPAAATVDRLRDLFARDLEVLDAACGTDFTDRWNYRESGGMAPQPAGMSSHASQPLCATA